MALSMREESTISQMADLLYDFLPGSGNQNTAFPLAAAQAHVGEFWPGGSKLPAVSQLLSLTLEHRRNRFCLLIQAIVRQSMTWRRGKGNPLTREEVEQLNALLRGVEFRIPDLTDTTFLDSLPRSGPAPEAKTTGPDPQLLADLEQRLIDISQLDAQPRGYAFEGFLKDLFDAYGLAAKAAFRLTGEQIDGSFELAGETYLLEARWQKAQTNAADLYAFSGKIGTKAVWTRGLFISHAGFSDDGLAAFGKARTSIICMDGYDLSEILSRRLPLDAVLGRKVRRAAETGGSLARVRDLFPA